ncbi:MAG TPA: hypothetical protein VFR01_06630 [Geobacterales bacterium]|nr:hypothetical protein [Geobacterales bacterium]
MTDLEKWQRGVTALTAEFQSLPALVVSRFQRLARQIIRCKMLIQAVSDSVEVGSLCQRCGGECCLRGKYHVTVIDLLVQLAAASPLPFPDFASGRCPYLSDHGCQMQAIHRPYPCITFNCDRIESLLESREIARFYRLSRRLSGLYDEVERCLGNRLRGGMLINVERDVLSGQRLLRP